MVGREKGREWKGKRVVKCNARREEKKRQSGCWDWRKHGKGKEKGAVKYDAGREEKKGQSECWDRKVKIRKDSHVWKSRTE